MAEAEPSAKLPGLICTFYSYKGGVGRSMALANVGVLMAVQGYRVLLVDWDLEAPGLEVFFRKGAKLNGDVTTKPGVVDLLTARATGTHLEWRDCLLKAEFFGHSLDILSSGRRTDDYQQRVQQLDWNTLYSDHRVGNYIDALRQEWRDTYEFVLIDSRTGITDIGDICTVILPDVLVLLFVTNYQNIEGIKNVVARAVKARSKLPVNRNKLLGVPVPARDERYHEYDKSVEWQNIFAKEFSDLYREWLPKQVTPADALNHIFLPYVSGWSFGERIPVIESERERADPTSLGAAYARLTALLSHRLDWSAIEAKASAADVVGTRVELSKAREAELRLAEELKGSEEELRKARQAKHEAELLLEADAKRREEESRLQEVERQKLEVKLEQTQSASARGRKLAQIASRTVSIMLVVLTAAGIWWYEKRPATPPPGWDHQDSYRGDCLALTGGNICARYEDGYVWLVSGAISGMEKKSEGGQNIQFATAGTGRYEHILNTNFVRIVRASNVYSQGQLVVRGTWSCNLDVGAEALDMSLADFWWEQISSAQRRLVPKNGAAFFVLGIRDFESVEYTDLQRYPYSTQSIDASDVANNSVSQMSIVGTGPKGGNRIPQGTVVAYKTKEGRLGKFRVEQYGYDLTIRWVTLTKGIAGTTAK